RREPSALTGEVAERFLRARRGRCVDLTGARALDPLLGYLRELGVVPERVRTDTPAERLLADYRDYLVRERGLMASSVDGHARVARLFLEGLAEPLEESLRALEAGDVTGFVVAQCRSGRLGAGAAKNLTAGLRSVAVRSCGGLGAGLGSGCGPERRWLAVELAAACARVRPGHEAAVEL
ncbi:MAG: hypothetical protein LC777_13775, partial [Actinobacteria bacterium]|nr:hypothetical protein [Actinomycetota bacterium]